MWYITFYGGIHGPQIPKSYDKAIPYPPIYTIYPYFIAQTGT